MFISALLAKVTGDNPVANLLWYRFVLLGFNIANVTLIASILRKCRPRYLLTGVILYAWNPIVVIFGQSKVDTVMVFFLLLAVLFLVLERNPLSLIALTLSVLVKLITFPLLAVWVLAYVRLQKWRQLLVGALLVGSTTFLLFFAFWEDSGLITELFALLKLGGSSAPNVARVLLQVGFVLLILGISLAQDASEEKMLLGWALVTLYFSIFLTRLGLAWYLMTLLALVAVVFDWRLIAVTVVLSFSAFLFNTWYSTFSSGFPAPDLFTAPRYLVYIAPPLLMSMVVVAIMFYQKAQTHMKLRPGLQQNKD